MELRRGEKCCWMTAQHLGSTRTVRAVKYKTVVRWQMGLFSVWHSGRIISQILVPLDAKCECFQWALSWPDCVDLIVLILTWYNAELFDPTSQWPGPPPSCDGIKIPRTAAVPLYCWQQQNLFDIWGFKITADTQSLALLGDNRWLWLVHIHILPCLL